VKAANGSWVNVIFILLLFLVFKDVFYTNGEYIVSSTFLRPRRITNYAYVNSIYSDLRARGQLSLYGYFIVLY